MLAFDFPGLQSGSPDGIALVDGAGAVLELVSYESVLTAVDGPAAGMTSVDVGVSETSAAPLGWSLQRSGTRINLDTEQTRATSKFHESDRNRAAICIGSH